MSKSTIPKLKISKAGFQEYLSAKPGRKYGVADGDDCPIAKYVKSIVGKAFTVNVDGQQIELTATKADEDQEFDTHYIALPKWAIKFIEKFDKLGTGNVPLANATGKKALELL
jgi:hypothetical protein